MNAREKAMAAGIGGLIAIFGLGLGVRALVFKPVKEMDKRISVIRGKIAKAQDERRQFFTAEDKLKGLNQRAFADSNDEASSHSGAMLTREIVKNGLKESEFTRLPAGPRKLRGASEIGWSVRGQGPLAKVVDLLYSLEESPYLHQLEGLSVSNGDGPGVAQVSFRFLTLVMDPAPAVTRTQLVAKVDLQGPPRKALETIVSRDILRPYIKRQTPPPAKGAPPAAPPSPSGPDNFRIVSLSEWNGQPEVHVRDAANQRTLRYTPGQELGGGVIATVDYRPRPMPGREFLQSFSRVILKVGNDFYAVEKGETLADKRKLAASDLPADIVAKQ